MKTGLKIAIGADHAGFDYKQAILGMFGDDIIFTDHGTYSSESADYPDFAHLVASAVEKGEADFGFLLCGSANGVAMTANKHHNNANVLCIPARHVSIEDTKKIIEIFLTEEFEGGRHANRVNKIGC